MSRSQLLARAGTDLVVAGTFYWIGCVALGALGSSSAVLAAPGCLRSAAVYSVLVVLVFANHGLYRTHGTLLNIGELARVTRGLALVAAAFLGALFLVGASEGRLAVTGGILLASLAVTTERRVVASFQKRLQLAGKLGRRVLLYGCGETGERLMKKIVQAPDLGCTVVGFLDDYATLGTRVGCRVSQTSPDRVEARVLGRLDDLRSVVRRNQIDELLITVPALAPWKLARLVEAAPELGIEIGIVPRLGAFRADQLRVEDVSGIPVLRPYGFHRRELYHAAKRAIDVTLSLVLLSLVAPVWLLACVLIRLESPGSAFFRQERVGLGGARFEMFKFRTMYEDVPAYARAPSSAEDPRITRVGRWLRTAGFDETPQLLNVLKGEMSLVGPRPEMPFIVEEYGEIERQRLLALPGITGLWQLSADRVSEIHQNIEYDLYYIQNRSILLDLAILLETVFFTASVLIHRLFELETVWLFADRPSEESPAEAAHGRRREGFILAALDQRLGGAVTEAWRALLPALYEVSQKRPVKMWLAERNVPLVDELVRETVGPRANQNGHPEYVPHSGRADLYRLSRQAELVLTDLPEIAAWAEGGPEVLLLDGGQIRRQEGDREVPDPVRAVLLELESVMGDGRGVPADVARGA